MEPEFQALSFDYLFSEADLPDNFVCSASLAKCKGLNLEILFAVLVAAT